MTNIYGKKLSGKDNFAYLLVSLIFILFSSALVDQFISGAGQGFILSSSIIAMVIGVWSIRSTDLIFNTGISIVIANIIIIIIITYLDSADLDFIHITLMLLFFLLTLKPAVEQALFANKITTNSITGSICIFLLLGLIWAMLYLLLEEFIPGSFSGVEITNWKDNLPDFIYFSFVTLTTLGFGDILPLSPLARFLVYMQAIVGVFYVAIIVSSLVSAKISEPREAPNY